MSSMVSCPNCPTQYSADEFAECPTCTRAANRAVELDIARDPETDPDTLGKLAFTKDPQVLQAVLANPRTPDWAVLRFGGARDREKPRETLTAAPQTGGGHHSDAYSSDVPAQMVGLREADRVWLSDLISEVTTAHKHVGDSTLTTLNRVLQAQLASANYTRVVALAVFLVIWNTLFAGLIVSLTVTAGPYDDYGGIITVLSLIWLGITIVILWLIGRAIFDAADARRAAEQAPSRR